MHWGSVQALRSIGGVEVQLYPFMTTAVEGGEGSVSRPGRSLPPYVPIVPEAGWGPGPVSTGAENLAPTGIRSPDRPTGSQSLYRLRYPAHMYRLLSVNCLTACVSTQVSQSSVSALGTLISPEKKYCDVIQNNQYMLWTSRLYLMISIK